VFSDSLASVAPGCRLVRHRCDRLGGGRPYFPFGADLRLRLVEQRAFRGGAVYLRYAKIG
jgi:hypothetical protein